MGRGQVVAFECSAIIRERRTNVQGTRRVHNKALCIGTMCCVMLVGIVRGVEY